MGVTYLLLHKVLLFSISKDAAVMLRNLMKYMYYELVLLYLKKLVFMLSTYELMKKKSLAFLVKDLSGFRHFWYLIAQRQYQI